MSEPSDTRYLVKTLRSSKGLTQEQFAHVIGVTFSTVNAWENGKHAPMPLLRRRLQSMAAELDLPVSAGDADAVAERSGQAGRKR